MPQTPQLPLDLRVERAARFENYRAAEADPVVALIRAHAEGYPTDGVHAGARPETVIFLWGTAGSGKSHLLESAAAHATAQQRRAAYTEGTALLSLEEGAEWDLLCVDGVDGIAGHADAERALFAAFEEMRSAGAQLLVAARQPPSEIAFDLPDLRSRLMWGPVLRIDPLDDTALKHHFAAQAERYGLRLNTDVVEYVMRHCSRDAGYLEALAEALHRYSLAERRHVTVRLVAQFLAQHAG